MFVLSCKYLWYIVTKFLLLSAKKKKVRLLSFHTYKNLKCLLLDWKGTGSQVKKSKIRKKAQMKKLRLVSYDFIVGKFTFFSFTLNFYKCLLLLHFLSDEAP